MPRAKLEMLQKKLEEYLLLGEIILSTVNAFADRGDIVRYKSGTIVRGLDDHAADTEPL